MLITINGNPEEIARLVIELQSGNTENALYDYEHGVKYTLSHDGKNGGGGGGKNDI